MNFKNNLYGEFPPLRITTANVNETQQCHTGHGKTSGFRNGSEIERAGGIGGI
jgi:hypothetical protein